MTSEKAIDILQISLALLSRYARQIKVKTVRVKYTLKFDFSKEDLYKIANIIDSFHKNNAKRNLLDSYFNNNISNSENPKKSSISPFIQQMRKEHPLVKDDRMFITSWFPPIDSYEFLTECNTVKRRS